MNKVLVIGTTEFLQTVRSKGFLIGIFVMPILMGGSILFQVLVKDQVDLDPRKAVVVDATGQLWEGLQQAAQEYNEREIWSTNEQGEKQQVQPRFELSQLPAESAAEPAQAQSARNRQRVELSQRVRSGELQGFFLIGSGVFDVGAAPEGAAPELIAEQRGVSYYTDEPTYETLKKWVAGVLNENIKEQRFEADEFDSKLKARVEQLSAYVPVNGYGLIEEKADGSIAGGERENKLRTFMVPLATLMMMFMLVMTSAPQLMNNVLEEKMQRISEVLVSAVTPFQLLLGKLVGGVFITLTLAVTYLGGVAWASYHYGFSEMIPGEIYLWFGVMTIFALFMYGALFSALGAACNELRDAQSMMMPAMAIVLIPMFAFSVIMENPNGTVAQVLTFVPTCTPMILLFRLAAQPGPEPWEVLLGLLDCVLTTWFLVWASAKIFRVGILSQGQPPTYRKLLGWLRESEAKSS